MTQPQGSGGSAAGPARRRELERGLALVRDRIEAACSTVGRRVEELTLVVVTKTYPESDVRALASLGIRNLAENRDQEASVKAAACADLGLSWHFVGQVQTNKARSVARYATMVHAVDRAGLVSALARATAARAVPLDCLIQVTLDGDASRGGATPQDVEGLAALIAAAPGLRVRGVMAVAPLGADPDGAFAALPPLLARLREHHPAADVISAGMSGDLEAAVRQGATHLRVGSAILGPRPTTG
jgi:pyridoxal phosphate enzyme (YggS family)